MSLIHQTASEIVNLLKTNKVSVVELLDALQARISEVDPAVNALPTLCFDRAKKQAEALEKKPAQNAACCVAYQ